MRQYLTQKVRVLREAYDFWRWQRQVWHVYQQDAAVRYCTEHLKCQLADAEADLDREGSVSFGEPITILEQTRARQATTLREAERKLALFECDYGSQLAIAYGNLKQINIALTNAFERLNDAKSDVKREKAYLHQWYSRAESRLPIYGKKGTSIPRHRLFGMSTAKRDRAKAQLEQAQARANESWSEVKALRSQRDKKREKIGALKLAREERNNLRRAGSSVASLSRAIAFATTDLTETVRKICALHADRNDFRQHSSFAQSVAEIERQIEALEKGHRACLDDFWSEEARKLRRQRFSARGATEGRG